ncbi:MarR family transcriptional regulator [Rhodopseudomonas boonkerdii]|uniref:MarR family winged helix-turn-helix transcriptional regulator n=1 Tax=Rhodopseudomonas boonkerdii TaxID=475937 RepID=UPI001E625232|nr:MarR family transcriptional regulator [Rhodopseudomonas boonkerdii]UGV28197.1 MarR family transcriptional regulator [Rhodopseudomonas boonkerdii]
MSCQPDTGTDFLSALFETQRMLRQLADKEARHLGMTRAQWAVLAKVERNEGQKQTELADAMEMAPISLTRLIDKLCDNGLIERRNDDTDRRIKRLYLTEAARPLMAKLAVLRSDLMQVAFAGLSEAEMHRLVDRLETIKDNIRAALNPAAAKTKERVYEQVSG